MHNPPSWYDPRTESSTMTERSFDEVVMEEEIEFYRNSRNPEEFQNSIRFKFFGWTYNDIVDFVEKESYQHLFCFFMLIISVLFISGFVCHTHEVLSENDGRDAAYWKIVDIEKGTLDIMQNFIEITNHVEDIEKFFLQNGHLLDQDEALQDLEKRSKSCSEAWQKILGNLNSIQLEESQTLARSMQKLIVDSTKADINGVDEMLHRIKNLQEKI